MNDNTLAKVTGGAAKVLWALVMVLMSTWVSFQESRIRSMEAAIHVGDVDREALRGRIDNTHSSFTTLLQERERRFSELQREVRRLQSRGATFEVQEDNP